MIDTGWLLAIKRARQLANDPDHAEHYAEVMASIEADGIDPARKLTPERLDGLLGSGSHHPSTSLP